MDQKEIAHIRQHLQLVGKVTICNTDLLNSLIKRGILSDEESSRLVSPCCFSPHEGYIPFISVCVLSPGRKASAKGSLPGCDTVIHNVNGDVGSA